MISIHALREEGDLYIPYYNAAGEISIHALREEGDTLTVSARIPSTYFYPRPPRGGRREKTGEFIEDKEFLSTPSARRATVTQAIRGQWPTYFYPRPPRGGRHQPDFIADFYFIFLSTPSARRATSHPPWCRCSAVYFYPRPPRGGRLFVPNRLLWEH